MRPIEEVYDWQNILLYGDFGVGKTHLAGTAVLVPDMCDILYISLEGGEKTLKEITRICKKNKIDPNKIMVIPVQTYGQYANIYEFLKIHVKARDADDLVTLRRLEAQVRGMQATDDEGKPIPLNTPQLLAEWDKMLEEAIPEPRKFKTVITDSLTEAQKYCMYQLLGIDPLKQKLDAEPDSAEWKDWGSSREMIQFLVRRFRDLPIHSIFICSKAEEQDSKKQYHYSPMLPGKLSDDVRGLVDTVGFIVGIPQEGGNLVRRVYLQGGMYGGVHVAAKHRYGTNLKGLWLDNPTMKTFYDLGQE
jgi:hypothetical protein